MTSINYKYTIKQKLILGFSVVLVLMALILASTYLLNRQISSYTYQIKDVEAPLEIMVQEVIGYDAMLTGDAHEALLHAESGEMDKVAEHKSRYDSIGIKLDDLLKKNARVLLERSKRSEEQKKEVYGYLSRLDKVNLDLVDLETRAFDALQKGDVKTARSLIVSDQYHSYKEDLYSLYLKWADVEKSVTAEYREKIINNSKLVLWINVIGGIVAFVFALIVAILITRSIVKPLDELTSIADELVAGNLNVKISADLKKSKGVVGRLSKAYDKLINNSQLGLKKFVEYKVGKFKA